MARVGDETAGFSVDFDAAYNAVRVRGWGFWSPDVASSFDVSVGQVCSGRAAGIELVMDLAALKPMRDEGQRSVGLLLGRMRSLGIVRATVTGATPLTRLQLLRIAREQGVKDSLRIS